MKFIITFGVLLASLTSYSQTYYTYEVQCVKDSKYSEQGKKMSIISNLDIPDGGYDPDSTFMVLRLESKTVELERAISGFDYVKAFVKRDSIREVVIRDWR